jgi:protein gp37
MFGSGPPAASVPHPTRSIPCTLRFLSVEPLLESVADLDLTGIGWVAVGGMSGPLHTTRKMNLK